MVVYYRATTPAADGSGKPQVRNFTHTWVQRGDTWRILGGMCREATP
ncbi:hypothetical protein [Phenylobacterium sp.]|nr:hypothetical protein [Phenylobacterium sp.]HLZ75333.1 hypothetical protein [Phenylobacterium sp.]